MTRSVEAARWIARFRALGEAFPLMSVPDFVAQQCAAYGPRTAIEVIETGEMLTYGALWKQIEKAAGALLLLGIKPGDRVAVQMRNGWHYPVLWLAIARIGAVHVPVNVRYTPEETAFVLKDSGARLMIVADMFEADAHTAQALSETDLNVETETAFFTSLAGTSKPTAHRPEPDALLNIQYTSGTTGMPKGCMLTHDYWLVLARGAAAWDAEPAKRILSAQPYFYMDPQWITLKTLLNGATMVIAPGLSSSRFLGWIIEHEIDWCMFPILMARQARTGREGTTRLKQVATFGWDAETSTHFENDFGALAREGFGMTEIGLGTAKPANLDNTISPASTGLAAPCRETSVRRSDGTEAQAGEQGELWVRGRSIFKGYWNRPDATSEACPGDGWFRTGDLFIKDADGFHWITGRIKDMIRRSSENIAAREVELALCSLPDIVEAAALAEPDPVRGEEVLAVLQHGELTPQPDALADYVAGAVKLLEGRLARFKWPRYWTFAEGYPRTPSNKVRKQQLRDQIRGQQAYDLAAKQLVTL